MQLSLLKTLSLSDLNKSDEKFVYFIAYLYSISTGEIEATDLVKTTQYSSYGKYSDAFRDAYRLGVGWTYGMAKSLEMIAMKVSRDSSNQLKQLLVKFAQVVRLGDRLSTYFKAELKGTILSFSIEYERKLEMQKLFLEMFYTLMSTAAFMIAANSIMTMLTGATSSELILVYSLFGVGISMSMFVVIMYVLFPRDKLGFSRDDVDLKFRIKVYLSIGAGAGIGMALIMSQAVPTSLIVGLSLAPLFYPGLLARKMEKQIKQINDWYPEFIRHFGEILSTVGSMGQALDAVLRSDFGPIQKYVISLKNRIKNKVDQRHGFELFSRDCGSEIVANGNQVVSTSLDKGGDMNETGNTIADITIKINELRGKRSQTVKTFESIIIVLHVLTLGVFGLMNKLTAIFFELISSVQISNNAFPLSPIDPAFMEMILPVMILMTSILSAVAIKVAQGGLYKTVFYHIALLAVLGSITTFAMDILMSDYLEASILDFGDVGT
jgi:archaeal flagellar protein FlaJ